jgi:hypothetical protein
LLSWLKTGSARGCSSAMQPSDINDNALGRSCRTNESCEEQCDPLDRCGDASPRPVWQVALYPLTTMIKQVRAATLCGAVLAAAIACERSRVREIDVVPPLSHVSIRASTPPLAVLSWRQDVDITLARDANVRELVDLRVFNGLQPGTTIEQARSQIGAPARAWADAAGTWCEYRNEWGTVQLGCERPRSVPATAASCNWVLYGHPVGTVPTIFGRAVVDQIEPAKKMTPRANDRTITLWRWDHTAIVGAFLERERIARMHLLADVR